MSAAVLFFDKKFAAKQGVSEEIRHVRSGVYSTG
jgi:hypothetical protein